MNLLEKTIKAIGHVNLQDLKVFDLEKNNPFYQYVIIGTGSKRQADALIGYVKEELKDVFEIRGIEGKSSGWLLIDCGEVLIHVFDEENRLFYKFDEKFLGIKDITEIIQQ